MGRRGPAPTDPEVLRLRGSYRSHRGRDPSVLTPARQVTRDRLIPKAEERVARLTAELRDAAWRLVCLKLNPGELSDVEADLRAGRASLQACIYFETEQYEQTVQIWAQDMDERGLVDILAAVPAHLGKEGS